MPFFNYFSKFIENYSELIEPNSIFRSPKENFRWEQEHKYCVSRIKNAFRIDVILALPDMSKIFYLMTDSSSKCLAAMIGQKDSNGNIQSVSFYSKSSSNADRNRFIYF